MRKLGWILILTVALGTSAASADGGYLGISFANGTLEATGAQQRFDTSELGFKLYGGYKFSRYFSTDLGYSKFGPFESTSEDETLSVDTQGLNAYVIGYLPMMPYLDLFGKAGLSAWEFDQTLTVAGEDPLTDKQTKSGLTWGVGLGFNIGKRFTIRLEYESFSFSDIDRLILLSGAFQYNF